MDWLELAKYIIDKLPIAALVFVICVAMVLWAIKSKKIPLWWGHKDGQYVTTEQMRANCEKRQNTLDAKLERIFAAINTASGKMDTLKDDLIERIGEHGERLAKLEGKLSR